MCQTCTPKHTQKARKSSPSACITAIAQGFFKVLICLFRTPNHVRNPTDAILYHIMNTPNNLC